MNINRLTNINFKHLGDWLLTEDSAIDYYVEDDSIINFLYAFVVGDQIKYIRY